jgi:hypothetical protein
MGKGFAWAAFVVGEDSGAIVRVGLGVKGLFCDLPAVKANVPVVRGGKLRLPSGVLGVRERGPGLARRPTLETRLLGGRAIKGERVRAQVGLPNRCPGTRGKSHCPIC